MAKKQGYLIHIPADPDLPLRKEPFKGKEPKYEDLSKAVGGFIERVQLLYNGKSHNAFANEEGLLKGLPYNARATAMYADHWKKKHIPVDAHIVGDVVMIYWEKTV
jgi:anthranilate/para-aminobenzoate synthase component II